MDYLHRTMIRSSLDVAHLMSSTTKCTMPGPEAAKFGVLIVLVATGVIKVAGILILKYEFP